MMLEHFFVRILYFFNILNIYIYFFQLCNTYKIQTSWWFFECCAVPCRDKVIWSAWTCGTAVSVVFKIFLSFNNASPTFHFRRLWCISFKSRSCTFCYSGCLISKCVWIPLFLVWSFIFFIELKNWNISIVTGIHYSIVTLILTLVLQHPQHKNDVLILLEHIFPNTYQGIINALYPAPDGFWLL